MTQPPQQSVTPSEEASDLAERLAAYRRRLAREGRDASVRRLDNAIEEALRATPAAKPSDRQTSKTA